MKRWSLRVILRLYWCESKVKEIKSKFIYKFFTVLYAPLSNLKKICSSEAEQTFSKVEWKYTGFYGSAWIFTLFSSEKIICTKGIELKNEYIIKFEFKTLYAQFKNDPTGRRKVFLSEGDEVTKSDVCIQEIWQRWGYKCSLATAVHVSDRSEKKRCNKHKCERDGETSPMPNVTYITVDIFETD